MDHVVFHQDPLWQNPGRDRDNAMRIDYLGFKVPQTKAVVYVVSGAFAGVSGSIYALFQNLISADGAFHIMASFAPVIDNHGGRSGQLFRPDLGIAAIFQIIEELTYPVYGTG